MTALAKAGAGSAPSAWQIERALSIANDALGELPEDHDAASTDLAEILAMLEQKGADIHGLMRRLLLAATEARANAKGVKERIDQLGARQDRFKRHEAACRAAALGIMTSLPELFPDGKFRDPAVDASVGQGKPGIVITDPEKLEDRFTVITRTPVMARIAGAIADGEVIEGASMRNGAPFITIRAS